MTVSDDTVFDIRAFGADTTGANLATEAVQRTLDACAAAGGGEVVFPRGVTRTGTVRPGGGTRIRLAAGAVWRASDALDDYGNDNGVLGLLYARDCADIALCGPGRIDGSGAAFVATSREGGGPEGPVAMQDRPGQLLLFCGCRGVTLDGFRIDDAPHWTISLTDCEDIAVRDLVIRNNPLIPNNDGINLACCRRAIVHGCDVVAGDDAVIVSGFNDHHGFAGFTGHDRPSAHVLVSDCLLSSRSAAVRIGAGANDIRDCLFHDLLIRDSNRGLLVWERDGSRIERLQFHDIVMATRRYDGSWWGKGEAIAVSSTPREAGGPRGTIAELGFERIRARADGGVLAWADPDAPIRNLVLADLDLRVPEGPSAALHGGVVDLRPAAPPVALQHEELAAIDLHGVHGARLERLRLHRADNTPPHMPFGLRLRACADVAQTDLDCPDAAKRQA
ncbi:MAG: glycoside hydrolase family 28 protein [Planctomycetota bacterium]